MSYTDSPELIASRLSSEIRSSESTTRSYITQTESRLDKRIHDLEMKLISSGAFHRCDLDRYLLLFPMMMFFIFVVLLCLTSHSAQSSNTEPRSQTTRSEVSTPQAAPTKEEGQ